jgi:hypothetical protein
VASRSRRELPCPPRRPTTVRWTALLLVVVVASACGGTREPGVAGRADLETYSSAIDGLAVSYPRTWHRVDTPSVQLGGGVEALGLGTGELPQGEQACSPYPWAAMRALDPGGLVLTLRVDDPGTDLGIDDGRAQPLASKPGDLLDLEPLRSDQLPGGCAVDGVEQRTVAFLAHGWLYTGFLAFRGQLSEDRRAELRGVWSSLTLRPIATGAESAARGRPYWHTLYTHCGIVGTRFAGSDWVAEPALTDGNGNPPPGWRNPGQAGTMTLVSRDEARFESRDGDRDATFLRRTPTDPPAGTCE